MPLTSPTAQMTRTRRQPLPTWQPTFSLSTVPRHIALRRRGLASSLRPSLTTVKRRSKKPVVLYSRTSNRGGTFELKSEYDEQLKIVSDLGNTLAKSEGKLAGRRLLAERTRVKDSPIVMFSGGGNCRPKATDLGLSGTASRLP